MVPANGACHPPMKKCAKRILAAYTRMYSAANSRPNLMPPYSVHQPSTSSASASGISKGILSTSAIILTKNSTPPNGIRKKSHAPEECWKCTISRKLKEPAITHTPRMESRRGISYAVNCAALLIPPRSVYLLLEDQPAKNTPRGAIPKIAKANRTESSGFAP